MKKKIIFLSLFLLIVFVIFNYRIFLSYYYNNLGNNEYKNQKYSEALKLHNKSLENLDKNDYIYNIANDYFQIGEQTNNNSEKIKNYEKSLDLYSEILQKDISDKNFYKKVQKNYEIVKNKLKKLKNQNLSENPDKTDQKNNGKSPHTNPLPMGEGVEQEENQENNEKNGENNEKKDLDEGKNNDDKNLSENSNKLKENGKEKSNLSKNSDKNTKQEEDKNKEQNQNLSENHDKNDNHNQKLLPAEKKNIDKYIDSIKKQGSKNMQYFNKKESNNTNDIFDTFFHNFNKDPFFDNTFDNGGEKDW